MFTEDISKNINSHTTTHLFDVDENCEKLSAINLSESLFKFIYYISLMCSYSKKNNFLVLTQLIYCCYEINQLRNCLNLYENEKNSIGVGKKYSFFCGKKNRKLAYID